MNFVDFVLVWLGALFGIVLFMYALWLAGEIMDARRRRSRAARLARDARIRELEREIYGDWNS